MNRWRRRAWPGPPSARVLIVLTFQTFNALAGNGMNSPGTGAVQLGMAGAGTAMAADAAATLRNPAAGAWLDSGMTAELGISVPDGGYEASARGPGATFGLLDITPGRDTSITGVFPVPSFARNWRLSDATAVGWGFSAAGLKALSQGNSATLARGIPGFEAHCDGDFGGGQPLSATTDLSGLCGRGGTKVGVDLTQVLVSGHWAYRLTPTLSVGVAPVFAAQRIHVRGLGAFAAFSNFPDRVTDNGFDFSYGGGARVGVLWELGYGIGIGAAYQSRLYQTEFDKYPGAIIGGSLDFAPVINVGVQFHVADGQRLLFDYEQIRYGDIKPLANPVEPQRFTDECFVPRLLARSQPNPPALNACLGRATGPGFGWSTINVYKLGYQGQQGRLTWRAGYSWGGNPLAKVQVLPQTFSPAVTEEHIAAGLSWQLSPRLNLGWALIYAVKNSVRVRNTLSSATPTVLEGGALSFDVGPDEGDQFIENQLSVWQSQFSMSWNFDR